MFWVFAFPVIMTCALGIAFRSRGAEPVIVGVVEQAGADEVAAALEQRRRLHGAARSRPTRSSARCATAARRSWWCRARRRPIASIEARAESQVARLAVDAALQRAAGRADAFAAGGAAGADTSARATSTGWCRDCSA